MPGAVGRDVKEPFAFVARRPKHKGELRAGLPLADRGPREQDFALDVGVAGVAARDIVLDTVLEQHHEPVRRKVRGGGECALSSRLV